MKGVPFDLFLPAVTSKLHQYDIFLFEETYRLLNDVLQSKSLDDAMVQLQQALPCLLHLENQTSEDSQAVHLIDHFP